MSGFIYCSRSSSSWSTGLPQSSSRRRLPPASEVQAELPGGSRRNQVRHRPGFQGHDELKRLGVSPLLVKGAGWLAAIGHGRR
jgi:hypothetical protein